MKTNVLIGARAYACIVTDTRSMDLLCEPGKSVQKSLENHVLTMRKKAAKLLSDADFIESAMPHFADYKVIKA